MAEIYSIILEDWDYWDGTKSWGGEGSKAARDKRYSIRRFWDVRQILLKRKPKINN